MTVFTRGRRVLAGALLAGLITTAVASATDPGDGTLSKSAPKVTWKGTITSSGVYYNAWDQDPTISCSAPACDPFTLHVADDGVNVSITNNVQGTNADGSVPGCGIRIKFPDGTYQWTGGGSCGEKQTMTVKLKNVKKGDYVIDLVASHVCCASEDFIGGAFIPELAGGTTPAPSPTPSGTPPAQPQPSPQLTVKASKASAKKLNKKKKYVISASSTGPLTSVTAALLKGKKAVGTGKLASLNGTAKITLKVKKVKAGSYTLTVSGKDSEGRTVTTGVKVKVSK